MKCKEAIAYDEWIDSEEGIMCASPHACLASSDSQYLRNRLWRAYMAGMTDGKNIQKETLKENFNKFLIS